MNDCKEQVKAMYNPRLMDAYYPQCEDDGSYRAQQYYGFANQYWCVNTETGVEIPGTKSFDKVDCSKFAEEGN